VTPALPGNRAFRARLGRIRAVLGAHLATFALAAAFGLAAYGAVSVLVRLERYLLD
jgi:hypothetical protein